MSESAQAPADSSNGSPPPPSPPSDSPPAKDGTPPSDTPPSPTGDGSSPPSSDQKTPSSPDQSSLSPPPPSESTPSSPPPTSGPPPPLKFDSSPPSPSSDSKTPPAPNSPPPKSSPPPDSKSSSPPSPNGSSSEPPSGSVIVHPPPASPSPPSGTPPSPPPASSSSSPSTPLAAGGSGSSPPAQPNAPPTPETSPVIIPPQLPRSPPAPRTQDPVPLTPSVPSTSTSPSTPGSNPSPRSTSPSMERGGRDSSTPDQSIPSPKSSGSSSSGSVAGVAVAGVIIIALVALFFVISRKRKRKGKAYYIAPPDNFSVQTDGYYYGQQHAMPVSGQSHEFYNGKPTPQSGTGATYGSSGGGHTYSFSGPDSGVFGTKSSFGYEELMEITNRFSRENVLGEGGFGCVYKGWLPDGRVVAVKQLKAGSGQGEREFRAEVEIISRVHHRHLVSLVGYCIAEYHRLLVYEFVPNNNLEHHLHGNAMPPLEWSKRMKIAVGSARGLAYLHEDCHPKIIHRDIKSANILLDDAFEAQVADFGLAKLSNDTYSHVSTRVMGTFGYMAPEYASSGKLTDRSDVFSFGVVLLELITGRKPIDASQDESLVEWARPLLIQALETGEISELVDPRLEKRYVESEMFRMIETAAACVRHSAPKRPRMVQVLRALDTEGDMPDLTNGVKVGQSTIFGPASEIQRFQRMAFGSGDSSDYDLYTGEFREVPLSSSTSRKPGESSSVELPSGELESRPMNPRVGSHRI